MQIKTTVSLPPYTCQNGYLSSTIQQTVSAGKDVGKGNPPALFAGMQTVVATVDSSMELPQI